MKYTITPCEGQIQLHLDLIFASGNNCHVELNNSTTTEKFCKMIKHLQNLPVSYSLFDNPYEIVYENAVSELLHYAKLPLINVDIDLSKLGQQDYLNYLHGIYEQRFDGNNIWLMWHEAIHAFEAIQSQNRRYVPYKIAYRELAGPLQQPFALDDLHALVTDVMPGDCWLGFSELGKTPYSYWKDKEPDDIERLKQLAKPSATFRPMLRIELFDHSLIPQDVDQFNEWFSKYKDEWCHHWNLTDWAIDQMFGVIKVGQVINFELFHSLIKNKDYICKTKLKH